MEFPNRSMAAAIDAHTFQMCADDISRSSHAPHHRIHREHLHRSTLTLTPYHVQPLRLIAPTSDGAVSGDQQIPSTIVVEVATREPSQALCPTRYILDHRATQGPWAFNLDRSIAQVVAQASTRPRNTLNLTLVIPRNNDSQLHGQLPDVCLIHGKTVDERLGGIRCLTDCTNRIASDCPRPILLEIRIGHRLHAFGIRLEQGITVVHDHRQAFTVADIEDNGLVPDLPPACQQITQPDLTPGGCSSNNQRAVPSHGISIACTCDRNRQHKTKKSGNPTPRFTEKSHHRSLQSRARSTNPTSCLPTRSGSGCLGHPSIARTTQSVTFFIRYNQPSNISHSSRPCSPSTISKRI